MKITLPDFVEWAKTLLDREDVSIALEQAFNQGIDYGKRLGYEKGSERGWVDYWDTYYGDED